MSVHTKIVNGNKLHLQYSSNLMALLTCCSLEQRLILCVGAQERAGREPSAHGLTVLDVALWGGEDETWGPVPAANKGSRTPWGSPTHLQVP